MLTREKIPDQYMKTYTAHFQNNILQGVNFHINKKKKNKLYDKRAQARQHD